MRAFSFGAPLKPLPPPPRTNDEAVNRWLVLLYGAFRELEGFVKSVGDLEGGEQPSDHAKLGNLNSAEYSHPTQAQLRELTDGGATTLHSHPTTVIPGDFNNSPALLALSGVTPAADTVPYFTSTTAAATTGLTAYSRTLLDDANAGAWRTTLGLGTMAVETATDYLAKSGNLSGLANTATSRTNVGLGSSDVVRFARLGIGKAATTGLDMALDASTYPIPVIFDIYEGATFKTSWVVGWEAATEYSYIGNYQNFPFVVITNNTERMRFSGTAASITGTLSVSDTISDSKGDVRTIPQNSKSADYTLVLSDAGKHILHPSADTTGRTFTIPANSSVAFPIGTAVTFVNQNSAGTITLAITTDTMRLAGSGSTGSRTLAANGIATAIKVTSTEWQISGTNLT